MDKIHKKIFRNLTIPVNYIDDLKVILEEHKKSFGNIDAGYLAALCFSYGIAIGKRQDRKRRRKGDIK
ncbi:hypothetical protein LN736_05740 [Clostridium sp. WLY-B-L2]|uniref:Uncharacterized protein n=1 Tax=Clostridium aromativorans TaxID=2836848 RepID=A0ABS8N3X9_9CLOT|nr:hypothetical protein [Clostridium aromativorans]MCC9294376.1 hypothetical protein [Clostridium aromativorans]